MTCFAGHGPCDQSNSTNGSFIFHLAWLFLRFLLLRTFFLLCLVQHTSLLSSLGHGQIQSSDTKIVLFFTINKSNFSITISQTDDTIRTVKWLVQLLVLSFDFIQHVYKYMISDVKGSFL